MKLNFTPEEVASVVFDLGNIFNITINKAGNIKLRWKIPFMTSVYYFGEGEKYYTFYKKPEGIILRAMTKTESGVRNSYPLNMKRTKTTVKGMYGDYTYQAYNINDSYFKDIESALEYFNNYIEKFHTNKVHQCEAV